MSEEVESSNPKKQVIIQISVCAGVFILCACIHFFTFNIEGTIGTILLSQSYVFAIALAGAMFGMAGAGAAGVLSLVSFITVVMLTKGATVGDYWGAIGFLSAFFIIGGGLLEYARKSYSGKIEKLEEEYSLLLGKYKKAAMAEEKLKEDDQKVKRLSSRMVSIQTITKMLGETLNPKVILGEILKTASGIFNITKGSVFILDSKKNMLTIKESVGWDVSEASKIKIPLGEGIPGYVAQSGEMVTVNEIKNDYKLGDLAKTSAVPTLMCAPLKHSEGVLGVLNIEEIENNKMPTSEESRLLDFLGILAGMAMNNAELHSEIKRLAEVDGLTKLYNNRYFKNFLDAEMKKAKENGTLVSILLSDIDHFKNFNDTYGHQIGDFVLVENAKVLQESVRENDLAARYGGEEFIAVLPDTDTKKAYEIAELYRKNVENSVYHEGGHTLRVTCSIGVATYPLHATDRDALVKVADEGLYIAKECGRNKTIITVEAQKQGLGEKLKEEKKAPVPATPPAAKPLSPAAKPVAKTVVSKPAVQTKTESKVVKWKLIKKIIKQPDGTQKIVQSKVKVEE